MASLLITLMSLPVIAAPYASLGLARNAAEENAAKRPAFSMANPAGPVFTEQEKEAQRQAGIALLERIRAAKASFTIPPGDYRLPCLEPITIEGLADLDIEATGVTLWMERPDDKLAAACWGLVFKGCRNVVLRGLTMDYDPPVFSQGRITSLDFATGKMELDIDPGYPLTDLHALQVIFFRPDGEYIPQPPHFHGGAKVLEDRKVAVALKSTEALRAQSEDPRIVEAFEGRSKVGVGDWAVLPFRTGATMSLEQSEAVTLEDVTLYAAPGFAFMESGGKGGHTYRRCMIIRRPGTNRLWAANADCLHSRMLEKGALVEECEFSYCGDDFLNFHSFWHLATHRFAPDRFVVFPHMYAPFAVGGKVAFHDQISAANQGEAVITAIEPLIDVDLLTKTKAAPEKYGFIPFHGDPVILTLDRELPDAGEGSLVDSRTMNSPGIVVRNNYFHDAMGRGALVQGVRDALFENNTWRDCNGGVQIFSCLWFFVEGPFPEGVTVRGNRLINADATPAVNSQYQPVNGTIAVSLVANGGNYQREAVVCRDIRIEDNVIYRSTNYPILVAYTRGVTITGNRIIEPRRYVHRIGYDASPTYYTSASGLPNPDCAIHVTASEDILIKGNRIDDPEGILAVPVCLGPHVTRAEVVE